MGPRCPALVLAIVLLLSPLACALDASSVFLYAGKSDCPAQTTKLYDGMLSSGQSGVQGGGSNWLCIAPDPDLWGDAIDRTGSILYFTEYWGSATSHNGAGNSGGDVPCSVCFIAANTHIHWGSNTCEQGFTDIFTGFFAANRYDWVMGYDPICLVDNPDGVGNPAAATSARLVYGGVWSSSTQGYFRGDLMPCTLCAGVGTNGGSVYPRWGVGRCNADEDLVYLGTTMSGRYDQGSTRRNLCADELPKGVINNVYAYQARLFPAEYRFSGGPVPHRAYHGGDVPCVMCKRRAETHSLTVAGTHKCASGFHLDSWGYLVGPYSTHRAAEWTCVGHDGVFESIQPSATTADAQLFYFAETNNFAGHVTNREINCAQCSTSEGPTYTRWGRTTCPRNHRLVYKGVMAGGKTSGNGVNTLCLVEEAEYHPDAQFSDAAEAGADVWPSRYHTSTVTKTSEPGSKFASLFDQGIPCAVCQIVAVDSERVPAGAVVEMFPAKMTCPAGWGRAYFGTVFGNINSGNTGEYVCIDDDPEGYTLPTASGGYMYMTEQVGIEGFDQSNLNLRCAMCFSPRSRPNLREIASYRRDFASVPIAGWSYLYSDETAGVEAVASYSTLTWDQVAHHYGCEAGVFPTSRDRCESLHLRLTGGGPGAGTTEGSASDVFSVAAFTVAESGYFQITRSWLQASGALEVQVLVDSTLLKTALREGGTTTSFNTDLGFLSAGSTVHVALGPQQASTGDSFDMDFEVSVSQCDPASAEPPTRGSVSVNTYKTEALYECDAGYLLLGASTRPCDEEGQWSGEPPVCWYQEEQSTTFLYAGRSDCPPNTKLVYEGVLAGPRRERQGSGANWQCMRPTADLFGDATHRAAGDLNFAVYYSQATSFEHMPASLNNQQVPCAMCLAPVSTFIHWGSKSCNDGFEPLYSGFIAGSPSNQAATSDTLCLTANLTTTGVLGSSIAAYLSFGKVKRTDAFRGYQLGDVLPCAMCHNDNVGGRVLPRWGTTTCDAGSVPLYVGATISSKYNAGGVAGMLCADDTPVAADLGSQVSDFAPHLYPVEYRVPSGTYRDRDGGDVACVVCHTPHTATALVVPGAISCPADFKQDFWGFLLGPHYSHRASEWTCIAEGTFEPVLGSNPVDSNSHLLYFAETRNFEDHIDHREVMCTQCSTVKGPTYTRWGRTTCPGHHHLVYKGRMAGSNQNNIGNGINTLCMVERAEYHPDVVFSDADLAGSDIWPTRYDTSAYTAKTEPGLTFRPLDGKGIPCAVCQIVEVEAERVPQGVTVQMFPGQARCPSGWGRAYAGVMFAGQYASRATEHMCVDEQPESYDLPTLAGGRLSITEVPASTSSRPPGFDQNYLNVRCAVCYTPPARPNLKSIANYRTDFAPVPATGWTYLYSDEAAGVASVASYHALTWNVAQSHFGCEAGVFPTSLGSCNSLHLGDLGGAPGGGSLNAGVFAVAAFSVAQSGYFQISRSQLRSLAGDVELRVYVDTELLKTSQRLASHAAPFNMDLGFLVSGATVYVGVGPKEVSPVDAFEIDFDIVVSQCDAAQIVAPNRGSASVNAYQTLATYQCAVGYVLGGDATRQCGEDGEWQGEAPECWFQEEQSSTFLYAGKLDCPAQTSKIYDGMLSGGASTLAGGGSNWLCMPSDPDRWGDMSNKASGHLYYAQYVAAAATHNGAGHNAGDVPCAVCYIDAPTHIHWGSNTCENGFTDVYSGYFAANQQGGVMSYDPLCLVDDAEKVGNVVANPTSARVSWGSVYSTTTAGYARNDMMPCTLCAALGTEFGTKKGNVYSRWGSSTCDASSEDLIYTGTTMSGAYSQGTTPRNLCADSTPSGVITQTDTACARLYPAEYRFGAGTPLVHRSFNGADLPCAVCHKRSAGNSLMVAGTHMCEPGFNLDYWGYLVGPYYNQRAAEWTCAGHNGVFESTGPPATTGDARLFYFAATRNFEDHVEFREIMCAQCSTSEGPTYTRWGRTTCPSDHRLVYSGHTAGAHSGHAGNGVNTLCLVEKAEYHPDAAFDDADGNSGYVYPTRYSTTDLGTTEPGSSFQPMHSQGVPCAVCQIAEVVEKRIPAAAVVEMFPGKAECPSGWGRAYSGTMFAGVHSSSHISQHVCVDDDPEGYTLLSAVGGMLFMIEVATTEKPPGFAQNYLNVRCAVCFSPFSRPNLSPVASYRGDFASNPTTGWSYLFSDQTAGVDDVASFRSLVWDPAQAHFGCAAGNFPTSLHKCHTLNLDSLGGAPGYGTDEGAVSDVFAVAAFTVPYPGYFQISRSWLQSVSGDLDLRVYVDSALVKTSQRKSQRTAPFDLDLGFLSVNSVVYVAVGPQKSSPAPAGDEFKMDFEIVVAQCDPDALVDPARGSVTVNTYQTVATYQCEPGYVLAGLAGDSRSCGEDGQWEGETPVCRYQEEPSSVFLYAGKSDCPAQTTKLYNGMLSGGRSDWTGGGSNWLCMPLDPDLHGDAIDRASGILYYAQYYSTASSHNGIGNNAGEVPCAMCTIDAQTHIHWGSNTCEAGFTDIYTGFFAANVYSSGMSYDPLCLIDTAEKIGDPVANGASARVAWGSVWTGPPAGYSSGDMMPCTLCAGSGTKAGSVYSRWGSASCGANEDPLYTGTTMSGAYNYGTTPRNICADSSPSGVVVQNYASSALIFPAEYRFGAGTPLAYRTFNGADLPCAVCHKRDAGNSLMVPGTYKCEPGFSLDYWGYLVGAHRSHRAAEWTCVGHNGVFERTGPDATTGSARLFYFAETLNLASHVDYREIMCAQCSTSKGPTYTRWGRTTCPANHRLVYKGNMGSSANSQKGNGANTLCMVEQGEYHPDADFDDANGDAGRVYPTMYYTASVTTTQEPGSKLSPLHLSGIPCAVCQIVEIPEERVPQGAVVDMFPGKGSCPSGWGRAYAGSIMSELHSGDNTHISEHVCVDDDPEGYSLPVKTGGVLYLTEVHNANKPPGFDQNFLNIRCAVCFSPYPRPGLVKVASYRADFASVPVGGWNYLYSDEGAGVSDVASFRPLLWDQAQLHYGCEIGVFPTTLHQCQALNLDRLGGAPGAATADANGPVSDVYSIAAFTVRSSGYFQIARSWLEASSGDLDLRVYVNAVLKKTSQRVSGSTAPFDMDLGFLSLGSVVYVAVGPQQSSAGDAFELDFEIVVAQCDVSVLEDPTRGSVSVNSFKTLASYQCEPGYTVVGTSTRLCGEDGEWEGEVPVCWKEEKPSSSFLYAGKSDCPPQTTKIYDGMLSGGVSNAQGSGSNWLCMPPDPDQWGDSINRASSNLFFAQYWMSTSSHNGNGNSAREVPCAMCSVEANTHVHWGRDDCAAGFSPLYTGFLAGNRYNWVMGYEPLCLIDTAETIGDPADPTSARVTWGAVWNPPQGYTKGDMMPCTLCVATTSKGSVYSRWGTSTCGADEDRVYGGTTLSGAFTHGSISLNICADSNPSGVVVQNYVESTLLYPVEYRFSGGPVPHRSYHGWDLPCSVCHKPQQANTMMVPGTYECPAGFHSDYWGYLTGPASSHRAGEWTCVGHNGVFEGTGVLTTTDSARLLYFTETLNFHGHLDNREVMCAHCSSSEGPLYTRWGRTECPRDHRLVYQGHAASSHGTGNGVNTLCMVEEGVTHPDALIDDLGQSGSDVYPTRYFTSAVTTNVRPGSTYFPLHNQGVPCAVCQIVEVEARSIPAGSVVEMFPGKTECPEGWGRAYSGSIFAGVSSGQHISEHICVDDDPEGYTLRASASGGKLYLAEITSSVQLPGFDQVNLNIRCAVCGKRVLVPAPPSCPTSLLISEHGVVSYSADRMEATYSCSLGYGLVTPDGVIARACDPTTNQWMGDWDSEAMCVPHSEDCSGACPAGTGLSSACSDSSNRQCDIDCVKGVSWNDGSFPACQLCSGCAPEDYPKVPCTRFLDDQCAPKVLPRCYEGLVYVADFNCPSGFLSTPPPSLEYNTTGQRYGRCTSHFTDLAHCKGWEVGWSSNLLLNPLAQIEDTAFWSVDEGSFTNGGVGNGFTTGNTDNQEAVRSQLIDLLALGFSPEFLDARPMVRVDVELEPRAPGIDHYSFSVEFRSQANPPSFGNAISQQQSVSAATTLRVEDRPASGSSLRYIWFTDAAWDSVTLAATAGPWVKNVAVYLNLDECAEDNGGCHLERQCYDQLMPPALCGLCTDGYTEFGARDCFDVDECADQSQKICGPFSRCKNSIGSYTCECMAGFQPLPEPQVGCEDIDECGADNGGCGARSCLNVIGNEFGTPLCLPTPINCSLTVDGLDNLPSCHFDLADNSGGEVLAIQTNDEADNFGAVAFGPPDDLGRFECTSMSASGTDISCTLSPGAFGAGLVLSYEACVSGTRCFFMPTENTGTFSFPAPTITAGSLHRWPDGALGPVLEGASIFGERVAFYGTGFPGRGLDMPSAFIVEYSSTDTGQTFACDRDPVLSNTTLIVCKTAAGYGTNYTFEIGWAPGQVVRGQDIYKYPEAPRIFAVQGCASDDPVTGATSGCATEGDTRVTFVGQSFGLEPSVTVQGQSCSDVEIITTNSELSCLLPPSNGGSSIVVVMDNVAQAFSLALPLVVYALPNVTELLGCDDSSDPLHAKRCDRQGAHTLTLRGSNFGALPPTILLGLDRLTNVQVVVPHREITCSLPSGNQQDLSVLFISGGGGVSTSRIELSYAKCQRGYRESGFACEECESGRFTSLPGLPECQDCPLGSAAPPASSSCDICDAGWFASAGMEACQKCGSGRYSGTIGTSLCLPCERGRAIAVNGSETCISCEAGTSQPHEGKAVCTPCAIGLFADDGGTKDCKACPPGKRTRTNTTSNTDCVPCEIGFFQNNSGQTFCSACAAGKFAFRDALPQCDDCLQGRFSVFDPAGTSACISCDAGFYQGAKGATECLPCEDGRFQSSPGAVVCTQCKAGSWAVQQPYGTPLCTPCEPASYQSASGASECIPCEKGYFIDAFGAQSCTPCAPGKHATSNECADCKAGYYQSEEGQSACLPCERGKFQSQPQGRLCEICEPGRFSKGTSESCTQCAEGFYQPNEGQDRCLPCPKGSFSKFRGQPECQVCDPGSIAAFDPNGTRACTTCDVGSHQPQEGQDVCFPCPKGQFATRKGQSECEVCQPGTFARFSQNGTQGCEQCAAGFHQIQAGQDVCIPCPSGTFAVQPGQGACEPCEPGSSAVFSENGTVSCALCAGGRYQKESGQVQCLLCDAGFEASEGSADCSRCVGGFSPRKGSAFCTRCPNQAVANSDATQCECNPGLYGYNSFNEDVSCLSCPLGADCNVRGTIWEQLAARPGYWRSSTNSTEFFRCLIPEHCMGGHLSRCGPNRRGPLCSLCDENFQGDIVCKACPAKSSSLTESIVFLFLVLLGFILTFLAVLRLSENQAKRVAKAKAREKRKHSSMSSLMELKTMKNLNSTLSRSNSKLDSNGDEVVNTNFNKLTAIETMGSSRAPNFMFKMKILVGFCQIALHISFAGNVPWPTYFQWFVSIFSFFNFDFIPWTSLSCLTPIGFLKKAWIVASLPFIVLLLLVVGFFIPMAVLDHRHEMSDNDDLRERQKISKRKFWKLCLFAAFLFYPFVSSTIFGVYNCITINDVTYLVRDFRVVCGSAEWLGTAMPMIAFVLLIPVGVPTLYLVVLYKNKARLKTPSMRLQLGFLCEAYGHHAWYFELVDMLHKLVLTSIIQFLPNTMEMPVSIGALTAYLMIILLLSPYIRKGDDRLHLLAQADLMLLAMMGFFLQINGKLDLTIDIIISVVLIGVVLVMLSTGLIMSIRNLWKIVRFYKRKKANKAIARASFNASASNVLQEEAELSQIRDPEAFVSDSQLVPL